MGIRRVERNPSTSMKPGGRKAQKEGGGTRGTPPQEVLAKDSMEKQLGDIEYTLGKKRGLQTTEGGKESQA